jgi:hypothetical protein
MSYLGTRNAVALGVSQHMTLGGSNLLTTLSPSLLLQFVGAETLDPRITFTRASTATFTGSNGLIQTAASGVARFDHNPTTLASLGLMIEESRTNLLTYSEQFDDAAWTKTRSSITANTIVAPDGTLTGDKLVEDTTASNTHIVSQSASFTSGTAYTFTTYIKAAERTWALLRLPASAFTSTLQAYFNLSAGVVGAVTPSTTASITPVGNDWYRCSVTGTATTTTSGAPGIFSAIADTVVSYTGDGVSGIYIWGAQLEVGAFATSYIPTVASQVTRAADVAQMTGTNFSDWYNATEGTLYSEASTYDVSSSRTGFGISDNTAPNRIQTGHGSGARAFISAGGVTQMSQTLASVVFSNNTASKVSLAYLLNNGNAAANGTLGSFDTNMTIPVVTQAQIGGLTASLLPLNGTVRQIVYYPRRLTDAELQAITS